VATKELGIDSAVEALLERSHVLGADPRVTNFGGGNTSVKVPSVDPATGAPITLMYIKGSGGDLGTLQRDGIAVLDLGRILESRSSYRGVEHEDDMFTLVEQHCCFGHSAAVPSIDTASHALIPMVTSTTCIQMRSSRSRPHATGSA
jgi:rhamnose utilization protein RhaD (predicted bifunctional aldolase and dehydrogenase)